MGSRTAKTSRISRRAVKSRCARGWGGWGRLSDDGARQHNSGKGEDPLGRRTTQDLYNTHNALIILHYPPVVHSMAYSLTYSSKNRSRAYIEIRHKGISFCKQHQMVMPRIYASYAQGHKPHHQQLSRR
jgi:hypothetical protein